MDVNYIKAFIESTTNVLSQFGMSDIKKNKVEKKSRLSSKYPVTIQIGIVGDIRGNITYNMQEETAKKLASIMMMGMEVLELDEMSKSALSEIANMITGGASASFGAMKKKTDISPPTLITGKNIIAWISQVETILVELETPIGIMELNIGLEV